MCLNRQKTYNYICKGLFTKTPRINCRNFCIFKISTSKTFKAITDQLIAEGRIKKGDLLIKVASTPIYVAGQTNTVKLDYA